MREIDLFAVVITNQLQRIFQHRHHSKAKQVDLYNSHVRAIVFIPFDDGAAGHGRRSERNNRIQLTLANHHTAEMFSHMPEQTMKPQTQLEKFANALPEHIEAGDAKFSLISPAL